MEFYDSMKMEPEQVAEPEAILTKLMAERKKLINGYYGDSRNDKQRLDESLLPAHYAISLSGEPTMYPKLPELIKYLKTLKATESIFLVTNGQEPDMIQKLQDEDALPTQLYLSTNAADYESFLKINKPKYDDSWERWNRTLDMLKHLDTRTVLRVTLIKDYNDQKEMIPTFAKMFKKASPHFIEIKSYMHIGRSTNRLEHSNMLEMNDIQNFSNQIAKHSKIFSVIDESIISRILILQNNERMINPIITV